MTDSILAVFLGSVVPHCCRCLVIVSSAPLWSSPQMAASALSALLNSEGLVAELSNSVLLAAYESQWCTLSGFQDWKLFFVVQITLEAKTLPLRLMKNFIQINLLVVPHKILFFMRHNMFLCSSESLEDLSLCH